MLQPGSRPVAPPRDAPRRPTRVEPVPGTGFGLAIFGAPPATSGPAVGAVLAGVAALLVSFVVGCLGLAGATAAGPDQATGQGVLLASGAFVVLTGFLAAAAIGLGAVGLRRTRPAGQPPSGARGRGMAVAGMVCGGVGAVIALCSLGGATIATLG
jgi:hypothetical protein